MNSIKNIFFVYSSSLQHITTWFLQFFISGIKNADVIVSPCLQSTNNPNCFLYLIIISIILKLSKNSLHELKQATRLKKHDLSNNQLEGIDSNIFANLNALEELNMATSGLKNLSSQLLAHQTNLKVLNVSCINLKNIDVNLFNSLKNLEILDISGNKLIKFKNFEKLREHFIKIKVLTLGNEKCNSQYLSTFIKALQEEGIINTITHKTSFL